MIVELLYDNDDYINPGVYSGHIPPTPDFAVIGAELIETTELDGMPWHARAVYNMTDSQFDLAQVMVLPPWHELKKTPLKCF